jgi:hypothetical protein
LWGGRGRGAKPPRAPRNGLPPGALYPIAARHVTRHRGARVTPTRRGNGGAGLLGHLPGLPYHRSGGWLLVVGPVVVISTSSGPTQRQPGLHGPVRRGEKRGSSSGTDRQAAPVLCMVSWPREARQGAGKNWRAGVGGLGRTASDATQRRWVGWRLGGRGPRQSHVRVRVLRRP